MKPSGAIALFLTCLLGVRAPAVEPPASIPPAEVGRLSLAAALLDYPIEQNAIRDALGIPATVQPAGVSFGSEGARKDRYFLWPLIENADGSRYELKTYYSGDPKETPGGGRLITAAEVIYSANSVGSFVADANTYPLLMAPRLKVMMKRDGLTPREFTELNTLRKYWKEALLQQDEEHKARLRNLPSNQTATPTKPNPNGGGAP